MTMRGNKDFVEKPADFVFQISIVNASEYDNGNKETSEIHLTLPQQADDIETALEEIGLPPDAEPGQYFINDRACILKSLNPLMDMHSDIHELAEVAKQLDTLDGFNMLKINAVMESGAAFENLAEVKEFTYNRDYYNLELDISDHTELGLSCIYKSGVFDTVPDYYKDAINPDAFGKYIAEAERGIFTTKGYLYPSGDKWQTVDLPDFKPKPLVHGADERPIDTTEHFAADLDSFYRGISNEYANMYDDEIKARYHIAALVQTGRTAELKEQICNMQKEYHLDNADVQPFLKRLEHFERCKGIEPESQKTRETPNLGEVDTATLIAFELDEFFREHDKKYAKKFPDPKTKKRDLADKLLTGETIEIKKQLDMMGQGHDDVFNMWLSAFEKEYRKPGRNLIYILSACNSNYKDMIAFVAADEKVYLGKRENYLFSTEHIPYYDNTDNSLIHVSNNKEMYYYLYGEGWDFSQEEMLKKGYCKESDFAEFAELQSGVLSQFEKKREFTFAGEPFHYYKNSKKQTKESEGKNMNEEVFKLRIENSEQKSVWIGFPCSGEDFKNTLAQGGFSNEDIEKANFTITGFVTDIPEYNNLSDFLSLHEVENTDGYVIRENVDELNYLATLLSNLSEQDKTAFCAALEAGEYNRNLKELINLAYNTEYYKVITDISDWADYGKYIALQNGFNTGNIGRIVNFIDFEGYGKQHADNHGGYLLDGIFLETGWTEFVNVYDGNPENIPQEYKISKNLQNAEKSTEQNYNHIYGIINKEPPKNKTLTDLHFKNNTGIINIGNGSTNIMISQHMKTDTRIEKFSSSKPPKPPKPSIKEQLQRTKQEQGKQPPKPPQKPEPER